MRDEKQLGTIEEMPIKVTIERDQPLDIATFSKALLSLNNAVDEYVSLSSGTSGIKATLNGVEKFNLRNTSSTSSSLASSKQ